MADPLDAPAPDLVIRPLVAGDADQVAAMLRDQRGGYLRFFYAFGAEPDSDRLRETLAAPRRDVYAGLFWADRLDAIFTLRGWDEGYAEPSFGLVVREDRRRFQLGIAALEAAKLVTRLRGSAGMMCKVHPDNRTTVRATLRYGFVKTGEEPGTGNGLYRLKV